MDAARLSDLRPRSVWDIADDAFDLYRERFATLAGLAAVPFVPAHLLNTLVTTLAYQRLTASQGTRDSGDVIVPLLIFFGATLAGQPILLTAQAIQTGLTARAVERRLTGLEVSGGKVWRDLLPRLFPLAVAGLLASLGVALAAGLSFGIGWFLLAPLWSFVPICVALERRGVFASFKRSQRLVGPSFWRVLGVISLLYVLEVGLQSGLSGLFQLVVVVLPGGLLKADSTATFVGAQGAAAIAALFLAPLKAVAVTLAYLDCRVRTEALDLVGLAHETGVALAEDPA